MYLFCEIMFVNIKKFCDGNIIMWYSKIYVDLYEWKYGILNILIGFI